MTNKILVQFFWDCRGGDLEGTFITTKEELEGLYGEDVHFGEVLGKHSDVSILMEEEFFSVISDCQEDLEVVERLFPYRRTISGVNPFNYIYD